MEEAAADYIKKFVKDTKLFSDAMKQPENQSWGRKFVESVKALIAKIKKVFTDQDARNAASIEATGKNLTEVEQAVKLWEKALEATTEGVKTSDRRISPKQAQKNTAGNGGEKMSLDRKYWKPMLTQNEWDLVAREMNRQIESDENFLDPATKWLYANKNGTEVFVIYGIGGGAEPTLLYASGGTKSANDYQHFLLYMEGENRGTNRKTVDRSAAAFNRRVDDILARQQRGQNSHLDDVARGTAANRNAPISSGEQQGNKGRNYNNSQENSPKVKYSLELSDETDSQGNQLSEGQKGYFADSKVRDAQGKLIPVYHGTGALFNEFSFDFINTHGSSEGRGFYFTDSRSMAEGYSKDSGRVMAGYLDIKKPLSNYERTISRQEVTRLIKAIDPTGDDLLANYDPTGGRGYPSQAWYNRALRDTVDIIMQNETDSDLLAEIANGGAGNASVMQAAHDLLGYDGYIEQNKYDGASVYVALDSSQFKDLDNKNPTSSKDTRYSMEGSEFFADEVMEAQEVEDATKRQLEYLRKQIAVTKNATADPKSVERIAGNLITSYGVELDKSDIAQDLQVLYDHILRGDNVDYWAEATDIARKIADGITETDGDIYTEFADLRKVLKVRRIYVPESVRKDILDSMTDYLKSLGYDGIQDKGGKFSGESHTVYIPFASEQMKESAAVTYDDSGNVIPLSERFNSENSDIRYSMEGTENIEEQVRRERLQQATEAYGDIPKGEKPARDVTVPRAVSQGKHVSYTIRTALEAGVTPESMVPKIQEKILAETFSDVRLANKDLMASANEWVRDFDRSNLDIRYSISPIGRW